MTQPQTDTVSQIADCANCGTALQVTKTGQYPWTKVLGTDDPLHFCGFDCQHEWQQKHCAWCGMSPRRGFLSASVVAGHPKPVFFCDVTHLQAWQKLS